VHSEILSGHRQADLRVYAVWFNMLFGDSRGAWDGDGLDDPRVVHFWDEQRVVGNWFTANVTHGRGTTWDFYALYGPDARDLAHPASSGSTIISRRDRLQAAIVPLFGGTSTS
jgi:hypothetical protein